MPGLGGGRAGERCVAPHGPPHQSGLEPLRHHVRKHTYLHLVGRDGRGERRGRPHGGLRHARRDLASRGRRGDGRHGRELGRERGREIQPPVRRHAAVGSVVRGRPVDRLEEPRSQLGGRRRGVCGSKQRHGPRHVWGRHRSPAYSLVVVRIGGVDLVARRGQVYLRPVVRPPRQHVVIIRRRDADHVRIVVRGREVLILVVARTFVACRSHVDDTVGARIGDSVVHRLDGPLGGPRVIDDGGTVVDRVGDGRRGIEKRATHRSDRLERHDADVLVDARDADAVVAHRADRARDVGAVLVTIARVVDSLVVVDPIPSVDVVDHLVAVVIDPVRRVRRVHPRVPRQVRM